MAGAFLGAVATWLTWIPHFKTVPEPPAQNRADNLLRKRDTIPKAAIDYISYQPHNPLSKLTLRRRKKAPRPNATATVPEEGDGQPVQKAEGLSKFHELESAKNPKIGDEGSLPGGKILRR